jgi:hypothetical protein
VPPRDARYHLYGLPYGNPYVIRPLDPLARESDEELLHELSGFVQVSELEATIRAAVDEGRPAFFLITGKGHSGRTSLANYVMHLYRRISGERMEGYRLATVCVERDEMTHDAYRQLRSTLLALRNRMNNLNIGIDPDLRGQFTELGKRATAEPLDDYELQAIAADAAAAFKTHDAGFGVRYEGVATKSLLTKAIRVFERTDTVVVFIVDSYKHASAVQLTGTDLEEFARRGHVVELCALTPLQMAQLAHHRWNGHPPSPFHFEGVRNVFAAHSYTIGQAMRRLHTLLEFRLSEYKGEQPWPTDGLTMDEEWLEIKKWQGETWSRLGDGHD